MVAVAPATASERAEVAVDGFDDPERYLVLAVGQEPLEVVQEREGELLEGGQPLPVQTAHPLVEETDRRPFVAVAPEPLDLLFEVVGLEGRRLRARASLSCESFRPLAACTLGERGP